MYRFPNEPGQPPAAPHPNDILCRGGPSVSPKHLVHLLKAQQPQLVLPRSFLHSIVHTCERAKSNSGETDAELDEVIHMCQHQLDTGLQLDTAEHAAEEEAKGDLARGN